MTNKTRTSVADSRLASVEEVDEVETPRSKLSLSSRRSMPVIMEGSSISPSSPTAFSERVTIPPSTRSYNMNPSSRTKKRLSLTIFSSDDARRIAQRELLKCPSVSRRRASLSYLEATTQLRRSGDNEEDEEDEEEPAPDVRRRFSFQKIGSRVNTLLKAKKMFNRYKEHKQDEDDTDETAFEIKEMPKTPRFASTLSAEAQYAMMKGYEDVVYGNICTSFPEYRPMLKRNRTPCHGVLVRPQVAGRSVSKVEEGTDHVDGSLGSGSEDELSDLKNDKQDMDDNHVERSSYIKVNASEKRSKEGHSRPSSDRLQDDQKGHKRLPSVVPKEKQLVLTYRYQSAMDILDTIRQKAGVHVLSPRLRQNQRGTVPVRDFNSWSHVWSLEFLPKSGLHDQRHQ